MEHGQAEGKALDIVKAKKAYALLLSVLNDRVLASLQVENTAHKIWKKKNEPMVRSVQLIKSRFGKYWQLLRKIFLFLIEVIVVKYIN